MKYLALFKIKNSDFDFTRYGLTDVFFSIDITKSIQASKGIKTTQYPLLDGTTRIDTISRAPGTLNFQGNIGELFSAKSLERAVKSSGDLTRMEVELMLLEDLRDNAIVLDVITHVKTYKNYIIESIGAGVSQFGISDINLSMKELLTFGDSIEIEENNSALLNSGAGSTDPLLLENFSIDDFENEEEMIDRIYNVVKNSDLSTPYMIHFGSEETSPDVYIKPYLMEIPTITRGGQGRVWTYTYTPLNVQLDANAQTVISGYVIDDIKIQIEIPQLKKGYLIEEGIQKEYDIEIYEPTFPETGKYEIVIKVFQKSEGKDVTIYSTVNKDLMVTPLFSNVLNGLNPLVENQTFTSNQIKTNGDLIAYKAAINFLRKCSHDTYRVVPNLLRDKGLGYLYPTFHLKRVNTNAGERYGYRVGFVYIHKDALPKIKEAIEVHAEKTSHFLYGKKIVWW